jgi:hypothetical protein
MGAMVEWPVTGQGIPWKPLSSAPRQVILRERTKIRLHPHLGELARDAFRADPTDRDWLLTRFPQGVIEA